MLLSAQRQSNNFLLFMATVLDGRVVRDTIREACIGTVEALPEVPVLAIVLVGDRPESALYVEQKEKFGASIGVTVRVLSFPEEIEKETLLSVIAELNVDETVTGIVVQLPLPAHLPATEIITAIDPVKDVDGLTADNIRHLTAGGKEGLLPATARAVHMLLAAYDIPVFGKHVVIVGHSLLAGKSIGLLLLNHGATVTICHKDTEVLETHTTRADILISATGVAGLITAQHVREGAVVIDVGTTLREGVLKGDVLPEVTEVAAAVSPVPGGVGPLTVAALFSNLLLAASLRH